MKKTQFNARLLHSLDDMQGAVDLQKTYWGEEDRALVPAHMLFSIAENGGHVLAAMDGDTLAGVVIGFVGMKPEAMISSSADVHIYSKRLIVSRDYRNHGLGAWLKFAQRDYALEHGIRRIVWTFDPLLSMNAHLNLRKLGALSRRFIKNYYGTENVGGLSPMGYSDRLYVEWLLDHERVERCAVGHCESATLGDYLDKGGTVVNPAVRDGDFFAPCKHVVDVAGQETLLVEIPRNYYDMMVQVPDLVGQWRAHNRDTLGVLLSGDYTVVDFVSEGEHVFYVLSKTEKMI